MNNNEDRAVRKVIIDPGHGGTDSGATGNNLLEKDYNLLISKYMYDRFKELGVPVAITRDSDTTLSPTDRVNTILFYYVMIWGIFYKLKKNLNIKSKFFDFFKLLN